MEIQHPLTLVPMGSDCETSPDPEKARAGWDDELPGTDEGKRVQHWSHHHPLKLSKEVNEEMGMYILCDICCEEISEQSDYGTCKPCKFRIHKSCMDLPREFQHRCHPHRLWLRYGKRSRWERYWCNTCLQLADDVRYESEKWKFNMCVGCTLFSQEGDSREYIFHFSHHHPLHLFHDPKKDKTDILNKRKLECLVCGSSASSLTYGCKDCDVYLHKSCLDILPLTIHMSEADVPLLLLLTRGQRQCVKCRNHSSDFHFLQMGVDLQEETWCITCALLEYLSVRVVSPSSVFSHQLHFHPCSLTLKLFLTFTCNACFTHCHTHAYNCNQCEFYVGITCAETSRKSFDDDKEWIRHFCHCHPLQASRDLEVSTAPCKICGSHCTRQPSYFCSDCYFHIHKSCLDILPQKIDNHYFNCTLILLTTLPYRCITCEEENNSGLAFLSVERGFKLCMKCVIWPENKQNEDRTFTSIHHWHQLELIVDKVEEDANCVLCRGKVSTSTTYYYCRECEDYFHIACAEFPSELQHQLHKQHPLALTSCHLLPESSRNCSMCQGDLLYNDLESHHAGVYHCKECGFQLDKKCLTSFPSIQYQGHPHLLTVVENMQGQEVCHVCSASCINNMVFRCAEVECKFILHLYCGPLPCNIKHSCHVHPLILEEFYVEENYTDLFPCHVCEERRDPRLPVYRCTDGCPMICEIKCVMSEVMPKLLGAHGDVEFRTTFPNVASKVTTKDEYVSSTRSPGFRFSHNNSIGVLHFPIDGLHAYYVWEIIRSWEGIMKRSRGLELEREDEDMFTFSREAFYRFSSKLEYTQLTLERDGIPDFILQHQFTEDRDGIPVSISKHNGQVSRGEFILPESLIPIYDEYFGKNSTIVATFDQCSENEGFKSFFVFILCAVFHSTRTTKFVDVTNERVLQWRTLLQLVEGGGFSIDFISDKLNRVWEAHFLIKAKAIMDDRSAQLDRRHKKLSRREEELLRELEDIRKEKEEVQKQELVHHKYAGDGMKSLRKEYAKVLLIKWKPVIDVVLEKEDQIMDAMESR